MNILQIANKAIYPPDGGNMAVLSLAKAYAKLGNKVCLLNMLTHKHTSNTISLDKDLFKDLRIQGVKVNTKINLFSLVFNLLFSKQAYIAKRFVSGAFYSELKKVIQNNAFDVVQLEGLYCLQYVHFIKKIFRGKIIYRSHNIEYKIWERNADEEKNLLKRAYFKILALRLKKLETKLLNQYDYILPISDLDADYYSQVGNIKPMLATPFGVDFSDVVQKKVLNEEYSISYLGALDWIPNQKGILWFVKECLPRIREQYPNLTLNIAGRNAPEKFIKELEGSNIRFWGEIEDVAEFYQTSNIFIVPLFSGSGMRVKIVEAMHNKKVVITTTIGAEGINCEHGKNSIIADDANDFVNSICWLLNDQEKQLEIGNNAYQLINEKYNNESIASRVLNFIR